MKLLPKNPIKVNERYFVISDEEINNETDVWLFNNSIIVTPETVSKYEDAISLNIPMKILCQLKSDSPIEGVPIAEETNVEELAEYSAGEELKKYRDYTGDEFNSHMVGFKECYTLANKEREYSEEEMRKAIEKAIHHDKYVAEDLDSFKTNNDLENHISINIIQSLPTKIFLLCDDDGSPLRINNTLKFVK